MEIGAGDAHDDGVAVGRNLRIGKLHDPATVLKPESLDYGAVGCYLFCARANEKVFKDIFQ